MIEEIGSRLDIEIRPFQLTKRQVLIDRLSYDPVVIDAIKTYAREKDMPLEMVQNKVVAYAKEIVPSFNAYFYFRIGYWIAKKIARLLYRVRVGLIADDHYKEIHPDSTVVFVMNHRSNIDYILVAFLAAERTTLSYAVGEWAKVWPLHMLFRFMGAFFVRRNSGNPLYRRVLERYIHMATQEGVCQAVFLEGGLSRDGRLSPPKLGLMDYMLRNFNPENDRDIVFIPVGINYDRTIEDRSLLRSLDPFAVKKGPWYIIRISILFICRNITQMLLSRWRRFGYACVNFGKPLSIKEYCHQHSIVFHKMAREKRFNEIKMLCDELIHEISNVIPVVPVSLLSMVFLKAIDTPMSFLEVEEQCNRIQKELSEKGAPVLDISRTAKSVTISDTLEMMILRRMIVQSDMGFQASSSQKALLNYYANAINHWINP